MVDSTPLNFIVKTNDDKSFILKEHVIRECALFSDTLCFAEVTDDDDLPCIEITSKIFKKVLKFFDYFKNAPQYVPPAFYNEDSRPSKNDVAIKYLMEMDHEELMIVAEAANFLNSALLIDYCIYIFLFAMHDKKTSELRQLFDLPSNYTEEEENDIHKAVRCPQF